MSRIALHNVNVHYPVLQDHYKSMRRAILRTVSRGRIYGGEGTAVVHALQDISLELNNGDKLALIGRNGAGKSTLLKTIGGFILPTSGDLTVDGKVTALFNINGGMDVERSGYDNVFLMGRLRGMKRKEMGRHLPDIEAFAGLGEFMHLPVRSYSDGMRIRLSLAIITCLTPEILVLDEAIGAGDVHFIEKAKQRASQLYDRANIIVMASHDVHILDRLCNKAIWIDQGRIVKTGGVQEVHAAYVGASAA